MANKKYNLATLDRERQNWQQPIPGSYDVSVYSTYLLKKQAVDMYIDGERLSQIQKTTGIYASRIGHLVDDCLQTEEDGSVAGYGDRAVIEQGASNAEIADRYNTPLNVTLPSLAQHDDLPNIPAKEPVNIDADTESADGTHD